MNATKNVDLFDLLILAGAILITLGAWLLSPAAGLIALGLLLTAAGLAGAGLKNNGRSSPRAWG
ncbi:MAG: hypothetical protein KF893_25525 [Caldilineaceae bacterium]|nr:hypothetical protein [Caldilineaceae bacterium]